MIQNHVLTKRPTTGQEKVAFSRRPKMRDKNEFCVLFNTCES